jgi:predicted outer membrane protein
MLRNLAIVTFLAAGALSFISQETSESTLRTGGAKQRESASDARDGVSAARTADWRLAKWLTMVQVNQVELARSALARASDPEVKRFAQKASDEHRRLIGKLRPFLASVELFAAGAPDEAGGPRERSSPSVHSRARGTLEFAHRLDSGALFDELGHQVLSTARAELETKRGAEFDGGYVSGVVRSHLEFRDLAVVFRRYASAELEAVLNDAQTATESRLSVAREFAERLERKALAERGNAGDTKELE